MRKICSVSIAVTLIALSSMAQEGAASPMGKVKDATGAGVPGTQVELLSETMPDSKFRTSADSAGVYHFSGLPADQYTLELVSPGFTSLRVKSVQVSDSERKSLPALQLDIGSMADCGGHADRDYIRFLPSGGHFGDLGGSVRSETGTRVKTTQPVAGANVTLLCAGRKICGVARTDSNGEFLFKTLPPGDLSVRVERPGFYPLKVPGYKIQSGLESVYRPIYIERCPMGNCDPRLRPKKPLVLCM